MLPMPTAAPTALSRNPRSEDQRWLFTRIVSQAPTPQCRSGRTSGITSLVQPYGSGARLSWMASSCSVAPAPDRQPLLADMTTVSSPITLIGQTIAAVPQANTSLHSLLESCRSSSAMDIVLSTTRQHGITRQHDQGVTGHPGKIESLRTAWCSSSPMTANKFIPESSSMFCRVVGSSHRATV